MRRLAAAAAAAAAAALTLLALAGAASAGPPAEPTLPGPAPAPPEDAPPADLEPAPAVPTRRPAPAHEVTLAAVGDIVMGDVPDLPPDGGAGLFTAVHRQLGGADLTLGNLEGTLSVGGVDPCPGEQGCFSFQTPPGYARWLRLAGFDVLNDANNHFGDYGPSGARQTIAALDAELLAHTGRPGDLPVLDANGVAVAFLGFSPHPWSNRFEDLVNARRLVREADRHADLVVVTFHAGGEGDAFRRVRSDGVPAEAFAHAVVDAGADLVVGHGPHVLRGLEWYRGRLIAYSLGNFAGWRVFNLAGWRGVSGILRVTLGRGGAWRRGELLPTRLAGPGVPVHDPAGRALGGARELSALDFGARAVRVAADGALRPPPAGR